MLLQATTVSLVGALFAGTPVQGQQPRSLEVEDMFAVKSVGAPVISPDGEWIAYTVSETSLEEESSKTRVWMVPTTGGEAIPMTAAGSSSRER